MQEIGCFDTVYYARLRQSKVVLKAAMFVVATESKEGARLWKIFVDEFAAWIWLLSM